MLDRRIANRGNLCGVSAATDNVTCMKLHVFFLPQGPRMPDSHHGKLIHSSLAGTLYRLLLIVELRGAVTS